MRNPNALRHSGPGRREGRNRPPSAASAKRILLVSRNLRLRSRLTRQLCTLGHSVWSINSEEDAPTTWSPRLYDVLVFSAEDAACMDGVYKAAKKGDSKLLVVMLAQEPLAVAGDVPDAVITENDEPSIVEKLLAIISVGAPEAA